QRRHSIRLCDDGTDSSAARLAKRGCANWRRVVADEGAGNGRAFDGGEKGCGGSRRYASSDCFGGGAESRGVGSAARVGGKNGIGTPDSCRDGHYRIRLARARARNGAGKSGTKD